MILITPEMIEARNRPDSIYSIILNNKPDFTELDKECEEFKKWIKEEHKKDKEIMKEALKANGRL